jgi:hypothetical protein
MIFPLTYNSLRPNRLTSKKDEAYHLQYARWAISVQSSQYYQNFVRNALVNRSFYQGNQWIFEEDLHHFLLDESGETRGRIKLKRNLVNQVVEFYRGTADGMKFNVKARAISPFAINRRENDKARLNFMSYAAQQAPAYQPMMEATLPIGRDEHEVNEQHDAVWTDQVEEQSNKLIDYIAHDVKINRIKNELATNLALDGVAIYKGYEYNGKYASEATMPLFFLWDMNAKRSDFKDAAYMGEIHFWDNSTIFERWENLGVDQRKWLENFSRSQIQTSYIPIYTMLSSMMGWTSANIPAAEIYWNDTEKKTYGWVKDDADYPMFCLINDENSKYKSKDLIEPPKEVQAKYKLKYDKLPEKSETRFIDTIRYCTFIPGEIVGSPSSNKGTDIVLEYGVVPYQDKNSFNISPAVYPYKCGTWKYYLGQVSSPIDDIIDTQRLLNRLLSASEAIINNQGSAGMVINKEAAADDPEGEAGIDSKMKRGKTVFLDGKGKGMTNTATPYDNTLKASSMNMFKIIQELSGSMSEITGINASMTGLQQGSGQLNGVTETKLQQGSVLLTSFFTVIKEVLEDAADDMISVGMKIYADNPRQLAIITGDKGAQVIRITKEMRMEDWKIFVKWEQDADQAIINVNGLMIQMLGQGLIDRDTFDDLYNRADMNDLAKGIRDYGKKMKQANILKQRDEQQQQQQMQQQIEQKKSDDENKMNQFKQEEALKVKDDQEFKLHSIDRKAMWKVEEMKMKAREARRTKK